MNGFTDLSKVQNKLKEADQKLKDAVYTVPSPKEDNVSTPPRELFFKAVSNP